MMHDQLQRNLRATQLAGAAVTHFLEGDEEALRSCLNDVPEPPGVSIGLLRFAALAVAMLAEVDKVTHAEVARAIVLRVAELDDGH
jgi:hypothetical protein